MSAFLALQSLVAKVSLPDGLGIGLADPGEAQPPLFPVEEAAVLRAVAGRRAEFAAGRAAARRALAALGHGDAAIPMAEDRAPIWPAGIVGSLSHTRRACVAIACPAERFLSVGIDIEDDLPLPDDALFAVGPPEEARPLCRDPRIAARRLFSLKEAAYKAQYPLTRTILDFEALRLTRHGDALVTTRAVPPFPKGTRLPVTLWTGGGVVLSFCGLMHGLLSRATEPALSLNPEEGEPS